MKIEPTGLCHFEAREVLLINIEVPFYMHVAVYVKHTNVYQRAIDEFGAFLLSEFCSKSHERKGSSQDSPRL